MIEERYEIKDEIGKGGVGAVFRAYDSQLKREVAIKRVLPEGGYEDSEIATQNLLKEATALSSVQHPHICTVYDAGIDDKGPYVVMELINGKTLDQMIERGTLTYEDFREVAIQSLEAMIAAQDLDLVHRDLKPSNVMVCWLPSGRFQVKLVDFGLAKFSAKPSLQTIDHGDAVFGSIFFMAPEQFERAPLDRRTDMYSLGALFYYALAGTYPFNGDTAPQVMASHLQNSVQPLHEIRPDLPHWLCNWVMWHISRYMDDRPDSARAALEKFLSDESGVSNPASRLLTPATTAQGIQPAISNSTSPQSITPPNGQPVTAAQTIRPAATQGGQGVQGSRGGAVTKSTYQTTQPHGAPSNHTVAIGKHAISNQPPNSKVRNTLLIIIGILGVGILGWLIVSTLLGGNKNEEFKNLIVQIKDDPSADIPTTTSQLDTLLMGLTAESVNEENVPAAMQRIRQSTPEPASSYSVDRAIFDYIADHNLKETQVVQLLKILNIRNPEDLYDDILNYAVEHPNTTATVEALDIVSGKAEEQQFKQYSALLALSSQRSVRTRAEKILQQIIGKSSNPSKYTQTLLDRADNTVEEEHRYTFYRLLASTGSDSAKGYLTDLLVNSNDDKVRIAASKALSLWPNDSTFDPILNAMQKETQPQLRRTMFDHAVDLLSADRKHDPETINVNWTILSTDSETDSQKRRIIQIMHGEKASWSTQILNYYREKNHSEAVRNYANKALKQKKK